MKPLVELVEEMRRNGWVYGWSLVDDAKAAERVLNVSIFGTDAGNNHVGEQRYATESAVIYLSVNGPFVCREDVWPFALKRVAQINAEPR
jgi:hypothetical protein